MVPLQRGRTVWAIWKMQPDSFLDDNIILLFREVLFSIYSWDMKSHTHTHTQKGTLKPFAKMHCNFLIRYGYVTKCGLWHYFILCFSASVVGDGDDVVVVLVVSFVVIINVFVVDYVTRPWVNDIFSFLSPRQTCALLYESWHLKKRQLLTNEKVLHQYHKPDNLQFHRWKEACFAVQLKVNDKQYQIMINETYIRIYVPAALHILGILN